MRKRTTLMFLLLVIPVFLVQGQTNTPVNPDAVNFPQWVRDLRRGEIVAFGTFPFSMFIASFSMDMVRWGRESGLSFSDRRYAPWPLKSAGGEPLTGQEAGRVVAIAAGISVTVAVADYVIILVRRNRERRRAEALPSGTFTINQTPWGTQDVPDEPDDADP